LCFHFKSTPTRKFFGSSFSKVRKYCSVSRQSVLQLFTETHAIIYTLED